VILTSYLTGQTNDPQRGTPVLPDDHDRMKLVKSAKDVNEPITIFHDQLSNEFISQYKTTSTRFELVCASPAHLSCCDYRYFLYRDWVGRHEHYKMCWFLDLFDVRLFRPLGGVLLDAPGYELWIGSTGKDYRIGGTGNSNKSKLWPRLLQLYGDRTSNLIGREVLMDGHWGGLTHSCLVVLNDVCEEIEAMSVKMFNCNMPVFNKVVWNLAEQLDVWVGNYPLVPDLGKNVRRSAGYISRHK